LVPAKDLDPWDHKDVWAFDQVFHPDATVRFLVLDSLIFAFLRCRALIAGALSRSAHL